MKIFGINQGWLFALGLVVSGSAYAADKVFPKPVCDTKAATVELHARLSSEPSPTYDGVGPWPGVFGTWSELKRGTYVTIRFEKSTASEWGVVRVTFYDLCTDDIQAVGAKVISSADWDRPSLNLRLRNFTLNGSNLVANVTDLDQEQSKAGACLEDSDRRLSIQIQEPAEGSASRLLRDTFTVVRP